MAITNYLVHFKTNETFEANKDQLRNDAVAFVGDATIIHTHGTDYYCGSSPVALKSDLENINKVCFIDLASELNLDVDSILNGNYASISTTAKAGTFQKILTALQNNQQIVGTFTATGGDDNVTINLIWEVSFIYGNSNLIYATFEGYTMLLSLGFSDQESVTGQVYNILMKDKNYNGNRILVTSDDSIPEESSITTTELNYLDGVTSNIQTQLNGKAASSHTHTASQVSGLANVATSGSYNDLSNKPSIPSLSGYATQSWVNTQLDDYLPLTGGTVTGNVTVNGSLSGTTVDALNLYANGPIYLIEGDELSESSGELTWNGTVVSLKGHTHSASDITSGILALARIPTGTSASTVALGNHTHTSFDNNVTIGSGYELYIDGPRGGATLTVKDNGGYDALAAKSGTSEDGSVILTESNYSNYISSTDTKNTTGTSNSTSKLYLAGGISQDPAGVVTYSNSAVYTQSGQLYANQMNSVDGFYETSDARLKNFKDDIKALDVVSEIPTKYFTWKKDETAENSDLKLHIGTSAQEIQKLYPDLVTENEEGELSVDYARLSIVALAAIKELKKEIDILKSASVK